MFSFFFLSRSLFTYNIYIFCQCTIRVQAAYENGFRNNRSCRRMVWYVIGFFSLSLYVDLPVFQAFCLRGNLTDRVFAE